MIKDNWNIKVKGKGLSANEIFEKLKLSRGINQCADFFEPSNYHILPYTDLSNIQEAANLFIHAIQNNWCVQVYADVDADGCSSAAIIYQYLRRCNVDVDTYINEKKKHGVQPEFTPNAKTNLIVIVDSINNDPAEYERLLNNNYHIIVLDHHVPSQSVLDIQKKINLVSSAVGNYGNPHLSGSGVCWKFVKYIDHLLHINYADDLVDLAAVGIIADVCSVGMDSMENRAICNMGFRSVNNVGLKTALDNKTDMVANDNGFSVGPLINAANRMNENYLALRLFLVDKVTDAKAIIKQLNSIKEKQKKLATEFFEKMELQADSQLDDKCMWFIVPDDVGSLTGLLATKAVSKYHRPCIVLHYDDERAKYAGSMRAEGVDDFSKIVNMSGFGECNGHENSAGIVVPGDTFSQLKHFVDFYLKDITFSTDYLVDLHLERMQVTPFLLNKLSQFNRISGQGFPPIRCLIEDVKNYSVRKMSQGKHICCETPDMKFIVWNFNDWDNVVEENGSLSAIGTLEQSTFMGRTTNQMLMEDYHFGIAPHQRSLW